MPEKIKKAVKNLIIQLKKPFNFLVFRINMKNQWYKFPLYITVFGLCILFFTILLRSNFIFLGGSLVILLSLFLSFALGWIILFETFLKGVVQIILTVFVFIGGIILVFVSLNFFENYLETGGWKVQKGVILEEPQGSFMEAALEGSNNKSSSLEGVDKNFQLYKGHQGGIYEYSVWLKDLPEGEIFIKAFEIENNIPLSEYRINKDSRVIVKKEERLVRYSSEDFIISEGTWGNY
jgi:hypothetical protein